MMDAAQNSEPTAPRSEPKGTGTSSIIEFLSVPDIEWILRQIEYRKRAIDSLNDIVA